MAVRRFAERDDAVCVPPQLWSAMPSLDSRICGMRRIPSMRGWYRDHIGKFRGEPKFQSQSQPKLPGALPVGSIFPCSPWVRLGRNWLIFTQPTFKNVT